MAMGWTSRISPSISNKTAELVFTIRKVELNKGGYAIGDVPFNGNYFGQGDPLFFVQDAEKDVQMVVRAPTKEQAIKFVLGQVSWRDNPLGTYEVFPKSRFRGVKKPPSEAGTP